MKYVAKKFCEIKSKDAKRYLDEYLGLCYKSMIPAGIYLLKVNNRNTPEQDVKYLKS